jgi:hypothetical protein
MSFYLKEEEEEIDHPNVKLEVVNISEKQENIELVYRIGLYVI